MNDNETQRIAAAINALRPDWPTQSLATLITSKLGTRTRRDVAVALTWVACDSATRSPARVLEAGPWWNAIADADGGAPRIDWLDRCVVCNYPEPGCQKVNAADHPFRSHRQAQGDRPRQRTPMPDEIRELVCSPPATDRRPYIPEDAMTTQTDRRDEAATSERD